MSSYSNNGQEGAIRATVLWEEVERARRALNRYQQAIGEALELGRSPAESKNVRAAKLELHTATLSAFTAIRPYAIDELELWEDRELDGDAGLVGLQCLEEYQLTWQEWTETTDNRHGGQTVSTHREMNYLTDLAYSNAVHAMLEGLKRDGFAPEPKEREIESEPLI